MITNEEMISLSDLLDVKLKANFAPLNNRMTRMELIMENSILPRIQNLESCYTSTYERYKNHADRAEAAYADIALIKKTVIEHSSKINEHNEKLEELSSKLDDHGRILNEHTRLLNEHSTKLGELSSKLDENTRILNEHGKKLDEHTRILNAHSVKLDRILDKLDQLAAG